MPDIPLSVGSKLELLRVFVLAKFPYTSPYTHDLSAYAVYIIYMTEAPRVLHFSAFIDFCTCSTYVLHLFHIFLMVHVNAATRMRTRTCARGLH